MDAKDFSKMPTSLGSFPKSLVVGENTTATEPFIQDLILGLKSLLDIDSSQRSLELIYHETKTWRTSDREKRLIDELRSRILSLKNEITNLREKKAKQKDKYERLLTQCVHSEAKLESQVYQYRYQLRDAKNEIDRLQRIVRS